MADRIGQQLGNYRLVRKLGQGGFAEVYLGEHIHLNNRQVAIKLLNTQLASSDELDLFRKEARTVADLDHPNIVKVLDFGVQDNTPFLMMDFAPNGTLRQHHLMGTPVPISTILTYVKQVASALQYAHDKKLIHRDIKPENMLLDKNNQVLLSDFGIALIAQSSRYQSIQELGGTAAYMAPEQIQGKPRPASDQYALGVVVYEWLCGNRPFQGSLHELYGQHITTPPPSLRERLSNLPTSIEQVVLAALAKDPQQRFGSVRAFAHALEQAYVSELWQPVNVVPPSPHIATPSAPLPPTEKAPPWLASPITSPLSPVPLTEKAQPGVTSPIQPVQWSQPAQRTQPITTATLDAWYREGFLARSQGGLNNLERAARLWQQILYVDPDYGNSTLAQSMAQLRQELEPLRVQRRIKNYRQQAYQANQAGELEQEIDAWEALLQLSPRDSEANRRIAMARSAWEREKARQLQHLRQQAEQAYRLGEWQQEINIWEAVQKLEPDDKHARERIAIASQNSQYAWKYDNTRQFASQGNLPAAQKLLEELWHDAPYYGDPDPAGLAMHLGMQVPSKLPASYEEFKRKELIKSLGGSGTIWFSLFCLLAGLGATVAILTQSSFWAVLTVALLTPLAYLPGYRKVLSPLSLIVIAILSGIAVFGLASYAATFPPYDQEAYYNTPIWLGRQIDFGLIIGGVLGFFGTGADNSSNTPAPDLIGVGLVVVIFIGPIVWGVGAVIALFNWWGFFFGFGFGFGWYISWIALSIGGVGAIGLAFWIAVMRRSWWRRS